ncbi:hypothetical protein CK203_097101 [Vitis vinifera]|uniref:Uncharacterized protein n=1 Tax=Vitis vinifera TaxID=29760 RepID=A0A438FJU5_VITVI|nr:hypothetical protein CK203_097101 [Vitis vinifera]
MEHLLAPRDFFYPRVVTDFYQTMTTKEVRNPTLIHFIIDGRHALDPKKGSSPGSLVQNVKGFFFGPHHLIMAALLYFEEKVHKKKLQRADCIPLLFPRLLCQVLEHLGYPLSLSRRKENMPLGSLSQLQGELPRQTRAITLATPAIPRAPPAAPAPSQPSTSAEPRMAIPISNIESCAVHWRLLQLPRAILLRNWQHQSMPGADVSLSGSTSCHPKAAPSPFRSATSCRALH